MHSLPRFLALLSATVAAPVWLPASDGLVKPFQETTLSAQVLGRIAEIPVAEGDSLELEAMVLRMDDRVEQLEVDRRKLVRDDRTELELAIRRAEVLSEEAQSLRGLYEESRGVSREEVNRKELDAAVAAAERQQLTNREELEEIEWRMATEQLSRRHVRAPFAGIVVELLIEEGEVCREGQPLARLVDISQCYLECYLDGSEGLSLGKGDTVEILVPAASGDLVERTGTVDYVSPVVDAASGLRRVNILFDNADGSIVAGLPGRLVGRAPTQS